MTIGVDCQGDRVEWQVIAWGRERRRWIVDAGVFPGHISDLKAQRSLDGLLEQTWPNVFGRKIAADMLAIDGNAWTEDVWGWAKGHPAGRVIMVRGANSEHAPLLARVKKERDNKGRLLKYARRFYNFGTSALKLALYRNLAKTDPEERAFIGLPRGLDDEFYRQLTAERRKPVKRKDGFTVFQWIKDAAQANEMLDTHLQAEAAAIRIGVRSMPDAVWDEWEAARDTPPPVGQLDLEDLMRPPPADAHGVRPEPASEPPPQPEPEPEPEAGGWLQVPQEDWING